MTEIDKIASSVSRRAGAHRLEMLAKDLTDTIWYVIGPPGMVKSLRMVLEASRVDADDIRKEEFIATEANPRPNNTL